MELTIQEVAQRLNMPVETVHRWIRQGKIPMQQSRGLYTIRSEMLNRWADEHKFKMQTASSHIAPAGLSADSEGLLPAMQRGGVLYGLEGDDREPVLRSIVDQLPNLEMADRALVYEKLLEREHLASTGIGHGIALPHPRANPGIEMALPQLTTCFLSKPIAYDAIDHRPVSVLMVLLSGSTKQHVSLLSKVSFFLRERGFRDYLLKAPAPDQASLWEKIAELDARER